MTGAHVPRYFADPGLSVLNCPVEVRAHAMKVHCSFVKQGEVAERRETVEQVFSFLPQAHAAQEGDGKGE